MSGNNTNQMIAQQSHFSKAYCKKVAFVELSEVAVLSERSDQAFVIMAPRNVK